MAATVRRFRALATMLLATLLLMLPSPALAAEGGLVLAGMSGDSVTGSVSAGYTAYVRDGDSVVVSLQVRNASGGDLDFVSMTECPSYPVEEGDDFEPIAFPPHGRTDITNAANASYVRDPHLTSATTGVGYYGYTVEAGKTATFNLIVSAGDLATGTYSWTIRLGRVRYDYAEDSDGNWPCVGHEVEETYSAKIPIKVVVYNQAGASLTVGDKTGSGTSTTVTPPTGGTIDFGTISLATTDDSALKAERTLYALNTSPQNVLKDSYGNTTSIRVVFGGEVGAGSVGYFNYGPFSWGNGTLYDSNWSPLPPVTTSGSSASFSFADYTVFLDATHQIAGTYTGWLFTSTTPHKVTFNGSTGNDTGEYRIPFTVTLTGTNPRLLPRATNLVATAGNGRVDLTWTPGAGATEYTEYSIWRRVGAETQTDSDKLDWSKYELIGTKAVGTDSQLLFVDGDAENGTTYSYTVICGNPCQGYAAKPASARPLSTYTAKMLAPDADGYDSVGRVTLYWTMSSRYGGADSDGSGMVDHFNVYRDGTLVDVIYRSAVEDDVAYGWHDDGTGTNTQVYGPTSHKYGWRIDVPVPDLYVPYGWQVSAVSPSGVESDLSDAVVAQALGETSSILSHNAWFDRYHYDDATGKEGPAILMYLEEYGDGDNIETLAIWRAQGTSAPSTSGTPYATCEKFSGYSYDMHDYADTNVKANATYTYAVQGTDADGNKTNVYTFTVKAVEDVYFASPDVEWSIVGGTTARMTWYGSYDYGTNKYVGTYKVYRNGSLIKTLSAADEYDVRDDPGADGTYVYRVDMTLSGVVVRGRELTFVRQAAGVDTSTLLQPPAAPTLTGRTSGASSVILSWAPSEEGGEPEGYHVYRSDCGQQKLGGRYVPVQRWYGTDDVWTSWGNGRYISLAGASTLTFVDGGSGNYKGDKYLGRLDGLDWGDDYLPHVYWVTAYNRAGESEPSAVVTFDTHDEDKYGNPIAPAAESDAAPAAPTITDVWVEWDDDSSYVGFDSAIAGEVRVAWSDLVLGEDPDLWTVTYDGTVWFPSPQTDDLELHEALLDPTAKLGTGEDSPICNVWANTGSRGELEHTLTVTVTAQNSAGSVTSAPAELDIRSFPRLYALADNGGAVLRWTDLFNDDVTRVTGWEVWRRAEHGVWERVATREATDGYDGTGKDDSRRDVGYYEWVDTGLDNGWTYEYKVVARCADGVDRPSSVREVTPVRTAAAEVPGAPLNLTATVTNGVVYFAWDAPASGGTPQYYQVMRHYDESWGSGWETTGTWVTGDSTGSTWVPSSAGTYECVVYAYSYIDGEKVPQGASSWETDDLDLLYPGTHSQTVTVTVTQADISSRPSGSPGDFSLTLTPGEGKVDVTWTSSANAIYYEVERYGVDGDRMGTVTVTSVAGQKGYAWTDESAEPGVKHRYVVTARGVSGSGLYRDGYATATGATRDEVVAARVSALIEALPEPNDVTVDDADDISEVQQVWEGLTAKQQALVDGSLAQKLADDVAAVEELALLARYAELVAPVQAIIDALPGAADVTTADANAIEAARAAFDALSPAEAKWLVRTARLTEAEAALGAARAHEADLAVAQQVIDAIEALPSVDGLTADDAEAVAAARAAYEALTDAQRALVPAELVQRLEECETVLAEELERIANEAAAAAVDELIEALPLPDEITAGGVDDVRAARTAYDALTDAQKELVEQLAKLEACEEAAAAFAPKVSIEDVSVTATTTPYTGFPIEPELAVVLGGERLVRDVDFEVVAWDGNVMPGTATVTVRGIGGYEGTAHGSFAIAEPFKDVAAKTAHYEDILWLYSTGITKGWGEYPNRTYRPLANVARADMAAFLYRLAGSPEYTPTDEDRAYFSDVTERTAHHDEIWWLASTGVTKGWTMGDGTHQFRPLANVARCDMAAFLMRMALGTDAESEYAVDPAWESYFGDINADSPHRTAVLWLAEQGVSAGWTVGSRHEFRPLNNVARADMAAFLHRMDNNGLVPEYV